MVPMQQQPSPASVDQSFGAQVNKYRQYRGLSQRAFAEHLNEKGMSVDASAISRIENGTRSVRLAEALVIADVLDVELGVLVLDTLTPSQEFRALRRAADMAMRSLEPAVLDFMDAFGDANRFLQENPELLEELDDEAIGRPSSPEAYLGWVKKRIKKTSSRPDAQFVIAQSEAEALALRNLVTQMADGLLVLEARSAEESQDNGEHPEEA